jgi:hypothetical protein
MRVRCACSLIKQMFTFGRARFWGGMEVGAEIGEDANSRRAARQSFRALLRGRTFLEGRLEGRHGNVELPSALPTGSRVGGA